MKNNNPNSVYNSIMKTYGLIFIIIIVFVVSVSLFVSRIGSIVENDASFEFFMQMLSVASTIAVIPLGYISTQRMIKNIDSELSLTEKLLPYRKALNLRFLSILFVAFLSSFLFLLTGNTNLMFILAIIILFYIISKPNPFKTADDLNLTAEDKEKIIGK